MALSETFGRSILPYEELDGWRRVAYKERWGSPGAGAWHAGEPRRSGTTHLLLEPLEFLEKLAALTPPPEAHLLLYHGVRAPHAAWRSPVVRFPRPTGEAVAEGPSGSPGLGGRQRYQTWAALMQRAFRLDVLACPRCGGRLRLIATISDPRVAERLVAQRGRRLESFAASLRRRSRRTRRATGADTPR